MYCASEMMRSLFCCCRQDVQGTAIDLARSNVEHHYNWIQEASAAFMRKYRTQVCMQMADS